MATNTAENRYDYAQDGVYGSLAYDVWNPQVLSDSFTKTEFDFPEKPKIREEVVTQHVPVGRQSVSPATVMGFLCAAVLLVFSLLARVQLTEITNETVSYQSQLSELETEQAKLLIAYESAFNLTEVEAYAKNELGMRRPTGDQVVYVDSSASDKAVIYETQEPQDSAGDRILDFLGELGEYLR